MAKADIISIFFGEETPTPKMWQFARVIADELQVEMPDYTFEDTACFLDNFKELFYHKRNIERARDFGQRVRAELSIWDFIGDD